MFGSIRPVRWPAIVLGAALVAALPLGGLTEDPYEINVILPLTGGAAFLGKEEAVSLGVVENMVNKAGGVRGRPIKFVEYDDQSNPQTAVQLTNQVIAKNVPVILGSSLVASCSAMAPLVKSGPVMYCFSPGIYPERGAYVFSSSLATKDLLTGTARYYRENGWRKVATITSTDATGQDGDARIAEAFGAPENSSETIVDKEHFNTTDISVAAQMTHIKASGAQAMIAWVTGTPFGTILRAAADAGVDIPLMTSTGNLVYPQLESYSAFIGDNVLFPASPGDAIDVLSNGPVKNAVNAYLTAFKAAGVKPDQGHTLSWDPALLVIDALKKFGFGMTATQLRDELVNLKGWTGINGVYDFTAVPQRGLSLSSVIIVRWNKAKGTWSSVSLPGAGLLPK